MNDAKQKLLTRINECNNVLVTVSANPSLDQLAGAIGLTLLLNKMGKHGTAVFSGEIPSILEYLKPQETLEKTTDSLRDFIIALDKTKADKLRYKVEDKMVKVFITPYKTSITEKDLEFSQGDFNVDLVIAIGAHEAKDLDNAIVTHGRILHDATVSSINNVDAGHLGTINWLDTSASSLCEMLYGLCQELKPDALDGQMATALLTGIVSETKRFGNEKTTARTLDISSQLMEAGANQQLVAARLEITPPEEPEEPEEPEPAPPKQPPKPPTPIQPDKIFKPAPKIKQEDTAGSLQVPHDEDTKEEESELEEIKIDEHGVLYRPTDEKPAPVQSAVPTNDHPPVINSSVDQNSQTNISDPSLVPPADDKDKNSDEMLPLPEPQVGNENKEIEETPADVQTLEEIEKSVASPHQGDGEEASSEPEKVILPPDLTDARDAVVNAVNSGQDLMPQPRIDLNANPGLENININSEPADPVSLPGVPSIIPSPAANDTPALPGNLATSVTEPVDTTASPNKPSSPPPVPPPMMPPGFGSSPASDSNS